MSYETARVFADTWGLVFLAALFVILVLWLFRRGATKSYERAARIPMDANEEFLEEPAKDAPSTPSSTPKDDTSKPRG
ncbi:MAG: cbb3-type cytochrome c oxidase subunit 3 [Pseudomonadota bacterium]